MTWPPGRPRNQRTAARDGSDAAQAGAGVIERLTLALSDGLLRVYDGERVRLIEEFIPEVDERTPAERLRVVVDRMKLPLDDDATSRLRDSVARAFSYGNGVCSLLCGERLHDFSSRFEADGIEFERPTEHLFSFNNPLGPVPCARDTAR